MTAEEFKNRYSGTTLIPGGGQDYQSADQWQKDIVNACSQTPWPGANLCATWTTRVYARAGHPVGGNGNTQLGNQGYGANYSQKRATTDLSQIKVGMLISAQYGSNTPAGNAYGHVGIYIGDGKVMDSIYSGLRTISLSDWVTGFYVGTVPAGYIAAWRAIKRSKLFVWGNALGLLLIATLLLSIPAAFAPIAFLLQWLKVSNLKRQLDANA